MKSVLLDEILREYIEKEWHQKKVVFVLPSKRSAHYAREKLKSICSDKKMSLVVPEFLSPDELIERITGLITLSQIDLIYYLYLSYQNILNDEAEEYFKFVKWAPVLLNDFNDVGMFLPNDATKQKNIFTNLKNIKEIANWSLNREPLSEKQKQYLNFMEKCYDIFCDFNNTLIQNGYAYAGLNYQKAVEQLTSTSLPAFITQKDLFVFVGLYAITPAEHKIYDSLKKMNKALFYWDYDPYYLKQEHEASVYFHKNFEAFGKNEITHSKFDEEKSIGIFSCSGEIEETLCVKKILTDLLNRDSELNDTAIILNKPENLELILSAIPENINYNVSMEFPLSRLSAFHFIIQVIKVFLSMDKDNKKVDKIYHKNFTAIFLNPFFKNYMRLNGVAVSSDDGDKNPVFKIIQLIQKYNKIFIHIPNDNIFEFLEKEKNQIDSDDICKIKEFLEIFHHTDKKEIISSLQTIFQTYLMKLNSDEKRDIVNINIAQSILGQLNRIQSILENDADKVIKTIRDLYALVFQIMSKESVSFKGEPMAGLQILGLLESRLLDFENLIFPFMNEGIFPPDTHEVSFFPYDLRAYYQLPLRDKDDAIYSYLFYRNLQHSRNIYLTYNISIVENKKLKNNKGEESRYVQQVRYELKEKPNIQVSDFKIKKPFSFNAPEPISIEKTDEIIGKLKQIIYSPSSIITYLDCSLKFYFRYVLKLRENEEVSEDLEANMEGTIFHKVMADVFKSAKDNNDILDLNKLKQIDKSFIEEKVNKEIMSHNYELKGKTLIQAQILTDEIFDLIKKECKAIEENNLKLKIIYLEEPAESRQKDEGIPLCLYDIHLSGIPDRIDFDIHTSTYRIIDYKSSISDRDILDFNKINNETYLGRKNYKTINKQLQLLIYMYHAICKKNMIPKPIQKMEGIIVPLRDGCEEKTIYHKIENFDINLIESAIQHFFINYILNKDDDFQQTGNTNLCQYCEFNYICKRDIQSFF